MNKELGRSEVSGSPRPLLRNALEESLIDDLKIWFEFLEARNESIHTYNRLTADEVYKRAISFPKYVKYLLEKLKEKSA